MTNHSIQEIINLISQTPLFHTLSANEQLRLANLVRSINLPSGAILFSEGDGGDIFYIVGEGQVEIIKALGTAEEQVLGIRLPGQFVGEMSLINRDGLRTATVRSIEPVWLIEITRVIFHDLLSRNPSIMYELMEILSKNLSSTTDLTIQTLQQKNELLQAAYDELKAAQAQLIEKERLERELQVAQEIQHSILPSNLPVLDGFELGALMRPARKVGGDFYDLFLLSEGQLAVVIGDVSDKGVPAAIFMAQANALLRAAARIGDSPAQIVRRANRLLVQMNSSGQFVTVLYGILHLNTGIFEYARAGHELPLLIDSQGESKVAPHQDGIVMGFFEDLLLDEGEIAISPGELLLIYTDGVTDGLKEDNNDRGVERLQTIACDAPRLSPQDFCESIYQTILTAQDGKPQFDDITLVAIRATNRL